MLTPSTKHPHMHVSPGNAEHVAALRNELSRQMRTNTGITAGSTVCVFGEDDNGYYIAKVHKRPYKVTATGGETTGTETFRKGTWVLQVVYFDCTRPWSEETGPGEYKLAKGAVCGRPHHMCGIAADPPCFAPHYDTIALHTLRLHIGAADLVKRRATRSQQHVTYFVPHNLHQKCASAVQKYAALA